jgi:predicted negative regulator of RcsB-dependent stress response
MPSFSEKALALILSGLFLCPILYGQSADLRFSPPAREACRNLTALRPGPARQDMDRLRKEEPANLMLHYLRHLEDFLDAMVYGRDEAYRRLTDDGRARLKAVQTCPADNPWREFCLGRMYLMTGIAALRRQEKLTASRHIRSGLAAIRRGQAAFPAFLPIRMDHTLLQALLATAPEGYHWALEWVSGLKVDPNGVATMAAIHRELQETGHFLAPEAGAFHLLLLSQLDRKPRQALPAGRNLLDSQPEQALLRFLVAWIAREAGDNDLCLAVLHAGKDNSFFPHARRLQGLAFLSRLETAAARTAFRQFLEQWPGSAYRAQCWQFMAWSHLAEGEPLQAQPYLEACAAEPDVHLEADAQARRQARAGPLPHPSLLRARLLFDGGYYERALRELEPVRLLSLSDRDQREFHYRLGRIHQSLNHPDAAINALSRAWQTGRNHDDHFACAAALQLGHIYADAGKATEARLWYERCLDERPSDHRYGLHQKARTGLRMVLNH